MAIGTLLSGKRLERVAMTGPPTVEPDRLLALAGGSTPARSRLAGLARRLGHSRDAVEPLGKALRTDRSRRSARTRAMLDSIVVETAAAAASGGDR
jgi:hypothetical protein